MAKDKLTDRRVKTAPKGLLGDGAGLFLRKESKDAGRWFYRYSWDGKRPEMGLGGWPTVTIKEARQRRDKWQAIRSAGQNPIETRDKELAAQKTERALKADNKLSLWVDKTLEALGGDLRGGGKAGRWDSPLRVHVLPEIGDKPIQEIEQVDIERVLEPIWKKKPVTARKAANRLRLVYDQAEAANLPVNRAIVDRALKVLGSQGHKESSIPSMPWQDVPSFYDALGEGVTELALRLLILTGSRSKPIRFAHEDQFADGVWTISAELMKGREGKTTDFRIPLSQEALQVVKLASLHARGGYLFPSVKRGVISDMTMAQHMKRAGLAYRPHGFRSSLRNWVAETTNTPLEVAKMTLGHATGSKVDQAYMRSDLIDKRRALLDRWADMVTGNANKVVQFRG